MTGEFRMALVAAMLVLTPLAGARAGDVDKGKDLFDTYCDECHTTNRGGSSRKAPNLFEVVGRKAGTVAGFEYTDANRAAGWEWSEDILDRYLTAPKQAVPGTNMKFKGVADAQERRDLIAYLATLHR